MTNATTTPAQPLGYINSRLSEAQVFAPFSRAQIVAYVVDRNNPTDRGAHPEYLGSRVTKEDQMIGKPGDVICYERTVNGYETMEDMQSGDTAWIVDEEARLVYMTLAPLNDGLVWVHIPEHALALAGGDPYRVQNGFYPKQGRYLPC